MLLNNDSLSYNVSTYVFERLFQKDPLLLYELAKLCIKNLYLVNRRGAGADLFLIPHLHLLYFRSNEQGSGQVCLPEVVKRAIYSIQRRGSAIGDYFDVSHCQQTKASSVVGQCMNILLWESLQAKREAAAGVNVNGV